MIEEIAKILSISRATCYRRPELVSEIKSAAGDVRSYIQNQFTSFLQDKNLEEGISAVLPYVSSTARVQYVRIQMEAIII